MSERLRLRSDEVSAGFFRAIGTPFGARAQGAFLLGRAVSNLLFGVTATDPLTFVAVSLLLTTVASAACFLPARRAMKVEPIVSLRQE